MHKGYCQVCSYTFRSFFTLGPNVLGIAYSLIIVTLVFVSLNIFVIILTLLVKSVSMAKVILMLFALPCIVFSLSSSHLHLNLEPLMITGLALQMPYLL